MESFQRLCSQEKTIPTEASLYGPHVLLFLFLLKNFELGCLAEQLIRDRPVSSLPETSVTLGHQVLRERQFVALCLVLFSLPPTFSLLAQDAVGDAGKKGEDRGKP